MSSARLNDKLSSTKLNDKLDSTTLNKDKLGKIEWQGWLNKTKQRWT